MSSQLKVFIFTLIIVATNWHWERKIEGTIGSVHPGIIPSSLPTYSTTTTIDGAGLWILFCSIALIVLGRRIYKDVRLLLDESVRVPREAKFAAWWPIVFLLPLFFAFSQTFVTNVDSKQMTTTFGYGSQGAGALFVLASLVIVAYQARVAIRTYVPGSKS